MNEYACCVFGHKKIHSTDKLSKKLYDIIEALITEENVDTFLLGSKSQFDDLCCELLKDFKKTYPHIKRIYVRAEYPDISEEYEKYLMNNYEETYFPKKIAKAGKSIYIERNFEMIDKSKYCITYYNEFYQPPQKRKSGTKIAYEYAIKKKRTVINSF